MSDPNIPVFVGLSSVLTGVPTNELSPFADVLDLKTVFYRKLVAEIGADEVNGLLARYASLAQGEGLDPKSPGAPDSAAARSVGEALMNPGAGAPQPAPRQSDICSSIIKMWYLGSWYPVERPQQADSHYFSGQVISSQAYKQGWVWKMAQAHPMGYSQYAFGYWTRVPPSLDDYVKGN